MRPANRQSGQTPAQQRGVALITALLIVALATIISVSISTHLQLDVRRTGNILASEQAMLYTLFGEKVARLALKEDRQNNDTDHSGEEWAQPAQFPLEGGSIKGQLSDLQACFNLNSLYTSGAVDPIAEARFRRLLANQQSAANINLNLNINTSVVTQSIIDWIDDDVNQATSDGAEDIYYMNLERPYRTANSPIQSVSELRVIRGFEESKTYDALINDAQENLVCAFGVPAPINVNTAPAEVLESLADNINASDVIKNRDDTPFNDMNDFLARNGLKDIKKDPKGLDTNGLSVSTEYFLLETEAIIGQARTLMYSIIQRQDNGDTNVIARMQGAY